MTENQSKSKTKDWVFWTKIIITQYLIRHPFWKSFAVPMIIGQISSETKTDYTTSNYLYVVYTLIALHFVSGVAVSDRNFRHALGFIPHLAGLSYTSYLFYSTILRHLNPWIRIQIVIHTLGSLAAYCFIASLHTKNVTLKTNLRRVANGLNAFFFVLNAYVLWWLNHEETEVFSTIFWTIFIRCHALIFFLVSGGFSLNLLTLRSSQMALYLLVFNIFIDGFTLYYRQAFRTNFWIIFDFLIDDFAMIGTFFYLYQFNRYQQSQTDEKID